MSNAIRDKLAQKKSKLGQAPVPVADHPADLNDYPEGSFLRVAVDLVQPNPYQPRQHFDPDKLAELAQSIRDKGVLQPILVRRAETGEIFLVAGERGCGLPSWRAWRKFPPWSPKDIRRRSPSSKTCSGRI